MLTSGISVGDADESTLWSTTFAEGLAQSDSKLALHLVFSFWTYPQNFEDAWSQLTWGHFFPCLNEKKECKKLENDRVKIMNSY